MQLRPYQEKAVAMTRLKLAETNIVSLVANTGSGKTVIVADICQKLTARGNRGLIIVPYSSLLDQFAETLHGFGFRLSKEAYKVLVAKYAGEDDEKHKQFSYLLKRSRDKHWIPEAIFFAGSKGNSDAYLKNATVVIAMAQTIESRGVPDGFYSCIFFDESHLSYFRTKLQDKLRQYRRKHPFKAVLLTATPWRADGASYPDGVEHYQVVTTAQQITAGYNAAFEYESLGMMSKSLASLERDLTISEETDLLDKIAPKEKSFHLLNDKDVFNQKSIFFFGRKSLALAYMRAFSDELFLSKVNNLSDEEVYQVRCYFFSLMQTLSQQSNFKLFQHLFEQFYKSVVGNKEMLLVCDSTPQKERQAAYKKFRAGDALLFTVTCLAIGFDEPSVENIILLRAFSKTSLALFIQIIGRGLRIYPGKEKCMVYDLCANPFFPLPDEIEDWNTILDKYPHLAPPDGKECPKCGQVNGLPMKTCYMCGADLPLLTKEEKEAKKAKAPAEDEEPGAFEKELLGIQDERKFIKRISIAGKAPKETYQILLKMAILSYGYKPGWAHFQFKKIFPGQAVGADWRRKAIFGEDATQENFYFYHFYLNRKYYDEADSNRKVYAALREEFGDRFAAFNTEYQRMKREFDARVPQILPGQPKQWFHILNVPPKAEEKAVKFAYRQLAKVYHPDVNSSPDAAAKMVEINNAYGEWEKLQALQEADSADDMGMAA